MVLKYVMIKGMQNVVFFILFCMIVFQFHVKMEKKKTYLKITEAYLETESAG